MAYRLCKTIISPVQATVFQIIKTIVAKLGTGAIFDYPIVTVADARVVLVSHDNNRIIYITHWLVDEKRIDA
jgi:hypothetical protein